MEWKVVLRHENGIDKVEIIGIGSDPHKPVEIIKNAKGMLAKKALKKIEELRDIGDLTVIVPAKSYDDMYAYEHWAGRVSDTDKSWKLETNLPKLKVPPYITDEEGRLYPI